LAFGWSQLRNPQTLNGAIADKRKLYKTRTRSNASHANSQQPIANSQNPTPMPFLTLTDVTKKGEGDFTLNDITFSQARLEKVAIAGETGAGKSTVMKIIAGLMQPDSGDVIFENERVRGPADKLVPGHPAIAYLSQHFELQKFLRVEQVLDYSNTLPPKESEKLFDVCQIKHLLKRKTDQLSGGEKQRIAICRLLISSPRLLLLDEPYAHLDMDHKFALKAIIRDIGQNLKITCTIVSHDPMDTLSWADQMIVMKDGRIIQKDRPEVVYRQPLNAYTGGLFGKYNLITPAMFRSYSVLPAFERWAHKANKKNIFIRPEQFRIVRERPNALKGKIKKISFFGSYRELEISVAGKTIIVRTDKAGPEPGTTVFIALGRGPLWFV
jgi:ABC-type sulfate/molybdate transport systems ATPase subunit